jgi:hypothetical protein
MLIHSRDTVSPEGPSKPTTNPNKPALCVTVSIHLILRGANWIKRPCSPPPRAAIACCRSLHLESPGCRLDPPRRLLDSSLHRLELPLLPPVASKVTVLRRLLLPAALCVCLLLCCVCVRACLLACCCPPPVAAACCIVCVLVAVLGVCACLLAAVLGLCA